MLSRLHNKLGTAGLVVAMVALVLAVGGTALAASALTGKQKKEVEKIAKKFAGKPGATGATGPAGPAGPAGSAGTDGKEGPQGKEGPIGKEGPQGKEGKEGPQGKEGKEGKPGQTGFTETLPEGKTETGAWSFGSILGSSFPVTSSPIADWGVVVPVSFPIPLSDPVAEGNAHYINANGKEVVLVDSGPPNFELEVKAVDQANPAPCPGSVSDPQAEPGAFCVYEGGLTPPVFITSQQIGPAVGEPLFQNTGTTGALLNAVVTGTPPGAGERLQGYGTWAVTAE